jgi:hypothetical protein
MADIAEHAGLRSLMGQDGDLMALNRELGARIREGTIDISNPALAAHLRATTVAKVQIDQPTYSGLKP